MSEIPVRVSSERTKLSFTLCGGGCLRGLRMMVAVVQVMRVMVMVVTVVRAIVMIIPCDRLALKDHIT